MGQDNVTFLAQSGKAKGHLVLNGPGQWAHAGWCWCFMNFVKFLRNIVLAHCTQGSFKLKIPLLKIRLKR